MHQDASVQQEHDPNLVELWLKKDPTRWAAGILGGLFAGGVSALVGGILAKTSGLGGWYLARVFALPFLGSGAMDYSNSSAIGIGLGFYLFLCAFWGILYAQFTVTDKFWPMLGVGFTWGAFSWIFLNNLYSKSWREVFVANVPAVGALVICMVYGFCLVSVATFDRVLRRKT